MMAPSIGSALNLARLLSSFFVSPESSSKSLSIFNPPSGMVDRNGGPREPSLVVEASSDARARPSSPASTPTPPLDAARTTTNLLVVVVVVVDDDAHLLSRPIQVDDKVSDEAPGTKHLVITAVIVVVATVVNDDAGLALVRRPGVILARHTARIVVVIGADIDHRRASSGCVVQCAVRRTE
jgi:hypothetical protein